MVIKSTKPNKKKVGIGITTKDRPQLLSNLIASIEKHTSNYTLYVADDSIEQQGVAKKKNECLNNLKHCDHIFLLDDDVEILQDGWIDFFTREGFQHLLFMNDKLHRFHKQIGRYQIYHDCGGVFMYMTKKAVERVGGFNEDLSPWGLEHAEYTNRIMGKRNWYPMLVGTGRYIFSHDYSTPGHQSSITNEEKNIYYKKNMIEYLKPIQQIYRPL